MEINTLVTNNLKPEIGIGCVSAILKKKVRVNFGLRDFVTIDPKHLNPVDVSQCKTISFNEFNAMSMNNSPNIPAKVIIGNEVKHYVGIGWVSHGVVTIDDLEKYPRLIQ